MSAMMKEWYMEAKRTECKVHGRNIHLFQVMEEFDRLDHKMYGSRAINEVMEFCVWEERKWFSMHGTIKNPDRECETCLFDAIQLGCNAYGWNVEMRDVESDEYALLRI